MRLLPFMKPKKGVTIAGVDYDSGGGGGGGSYTLPTATQNRLGGIKVGSGLSVESDGTLSASGGGGSYDYSTTEFNTGQKWVDGKDIYGISFVGELDSSQTYDTSNGFTFSNVSINHTIIGFDGVLGDNQGDSGDYVDNVHHIHNNKSDNKIVVYPTGRLFQPNTGSKVYFTIYYTKPTA